MKIWEYWYHIDGIYPVWHVPRHCTPPHPAASDLQCNAFMENVNQYLSFWCIVTVQSWKGENRMQSHRIELNWSPFGALFCFMENVNIYGQFKYLLLLFVHLGRFDQLSLLLFPLLFARFPSIIQYFPVLCKFFRFYITIYFGLYVEHCCFISPVVVVVVVVVYDVKFYHLLFYCILCGYLDAFCYVFYYVFMASGANNCMLWVHLFIGK